jgi:hypothetical protein
MKLIGIMTAGGIAIAALLASGCSRTVGDGPSKVVERFYIVKSTLGITGAPTPQQLATLSPGFSSELVALLKQARQMHDD